MTGSRRAATPLAPLNRDLAATAALALYSFVVGVGFARVFSGWDFVPHFLLLVIAGHGSSLAMRRARVSGWISVPVMTLLMLWVVSLYQYQATLTWLVPGRATWQQFRLDIDVVRDQFQTAVAPVIYEVGWATLAGLALVIVIVMADAFAFKAEARGEALVPGGVLFVFIAALSRDRMRLGSAMLLVGAGIVAVIALRNLHDRSRQVELTAGRSRRPLAWPAAIGAAVAIALLAGIVGPRIPGADADPLYQTRGRGGGITSVGNPLVDIRSRLVNHGDFELFRMNSDTESYWRLTTLPDFDGRTFKLPSRPLDRVDDTTAGGEANGRTIRQQIQVLALTDKMVPAAATVAQVAPNQEMRINPDTGTLLKLTDLQSGEQFTIVSESPDLTPDELRAAGTANPPDDIFLELPDGVPASVSALAGEVTARATTDYDRVFALEHWFRDNFEYSTEVQAGHGNNAIENFLQIRKGYCEQFAATFAVMARTLGIPSRVAVGYTPGRLRADGWYSVLGRNSHAWPEIWFDGVGWVPFEPTPSRGIPGAESYTGVVAAQDDSVPDAGTFEPGAATLPPTPTTVFSPPTTLRPRTDRIDDPDARASAQPSPSGTPKPQQQSSSFPWILLAIPVIILAALAFPAVARHWNRRAARQQGAQQRVDRAWQHACRAASRAGVDGSASMTSREWADATAHKLPVAARPMASLASVVDRVNYARPESIEPHRAQTFGRDCELWSDQVTRIATDTLTTSERMRQYFRDLN